MSDETGDNRSSRFMDAGRISQQSSQDEIWKTHEGSYGRGIEEKKNGTHHLHMLEVKSPSGRVDREGEVAYSSFTVPAALLFT